MRPYLEKKFTKTGLVKWVKVKALSSRPSTAKTNKQTNKQQANKTCKAKKDSRENSGSSQISILHILFKFSQQTESR
jgi:hypothetical protein